MPVSVRVDRYALLNDHAATHDDHRVGDEERLALVVGYEHRRHAEPPQHRGEVVAQLCAQLRVQRGEGLVEQEEIRLGGQRTRERDALRLPAES